MRKSLTCLFAVSFAVCAAQLPRKSPELQIQMPGGKTVLLSQYKGKPVVLAFILTTCSHCQYTTGLLVKMQNEFGPKGLQVLECAVNTGADVLVPAFTQQYKTNFPVGYNFDQDFILSTYMQHPMDKNPTMPMLVFIDRKGMIRAQYEGSDSFIEDPKQEQNIRGEIQKLLAAPVTSR
jgi:peroxiredoxin